MVRGSPNNWSSFTGQRSAHTGVVSTTRSSADGEIRKPNGEIYQNTDDDWKWLSTNPAKAARWLGYIPFDRIIDQRNDRRRSSIVRQGLHLEACLSIGLDVEIPDVDDIEPLPIARGFVARQAFHFAIFGEKSSLEDVVLPIAEQYEADLYLPTGEISDTLVYQIAKEANDDGRPLVMFTLSDCDPAGHQMPVSIARKLQAFADLFFPDLRFEVVPVALTPEQVKAEKPAVDAAEEDGEQGEPLERSLRHRADRNRCADHADQA